jgi:hypothetical protein
MDHLSNSDRDVDAGNGLRLYHGRVYSHLAGIGGRSRGDTADQWTSSPLKDRQQIEGCWDFPGALQVI